MRRMIASALVLGIFSTVGLIGCGEESKVEEKTTVSGPGGETTIKKETSVDQSGSNPPAATGATPGATPGTTP